MLLGCQGPPCLIGTASAFSWAAIAATLSLGVPSGFRRNCLIRVRAAASAVFQPNPIGRPRREWPRVGSRLTAFPTICGQPDEVVARPTGY